MVAARVGRDRHPAAPRPHGVGQAGGGARIDHRVGLHRHQEQGRLVAIDEGGNAGTVAPVHRKDRGVRARQEAAHLVGAGEQHIAGDRIGRHAGIGEIARIGGEHRRIEGTGRVAADEQGMAPAEFGDQHPRAGDGQRAVRDELRKDGLGIEPVVGDGDDEAGLGQRARRAGEVGLGAALPPAAVEEDQRRRIVGDVGRHVEVEGLPSEIAVRHVPAHRRRPRRRVRDAGEKQQRRQQRPHGLHPPAGAAFSFLGGAVPFSVTKEIAAAIRHQSAPKIIAAE